MRSVSAEDSLYSRSSYYIDKITEGDKMRAENFILNKPGEQAGDREAVKSVKT